MQAQSPNLSKQRKERRSDVHDIPPRRKKAAPTVCWECRAVHARGRWSWKAQLSVPADICLPSVLCPACQRIRDGKPLHVLRVEGLSRSLASDIRGIAKRVEREERATHPQERLLPVEVSKDSLTIGTTGMHLAKQLAAAILRMRKHEVEVLRQNDVETCLGCRRTKAARAR
jgi:hypothetical protein